jgi:hypothetical protein
VAQVPPQQARYAARVHRGPAQRRRGARAVPVLRQGQESVIRRGFAILEFVWLKLAGLAAWLAWAMIHLVFLPAAGNRFSVFRQWAWSCLINQQESRLILEVQRTPPSERVLLLGRDIATVDEYLGGVPVLGLARQPASALDEQNALARRGQVPGQGTAAGPAADDDVVRCGHCRVLRAPG